MNLVTTEDGFLTNLADWSPDAAQYLAAQQHIVLTDDHWEIILLLREFYLEYGASPSMRTLVNIVKLKHGTEKGNSVFLHKLFPGGPAMQANLIAGLPKPIRCM